MIPGWKVNQKPSQQCLERVKRDLADFHADPPPGVFMAPDEKNITTVHAVVVGAAGTSYEGGFFHLLITCTKEYPMSPPSVRFMTTDGGRVTFNPHISAGGHICLSLLGTMVGPPWTPAHNLTSVAVSIQSMLDDTVRNVDAFEAFEQIVTGFWNPGNAKAMRYQTLRVAVCNTIESCLEGNCPFPPSLRDQLLASFADNYAKYEEAAKAELAANQGGVLVWLGCENKYETLLARIQKLGRMVKSRNDAAAAAAPDARENR
ncbi:ubiquitin-conjugating enzyme E2 Z-like [Dermacentor albipictus]|uniref:ubiquitin-conjugating enzyme E2 Z-like n=1 Tax=Dermacentor albipictus TaxID=60249 RepID=UPI0038FCFCEE